MKVGGRMSGSYAGVVFLRVDFNLDVEYLGLV